MSKQTKIAKPISNASKAIAQIQRKKKGQGQQANQSQSKINFLDTINGGELTGKNPIASSITAIQPKLKVGAPNDKYEVEADQMADKVMRMPAPEKKASESHSGKATGMPAVQRKCTTCEAENEEQEAPVLQKKEMNLLSGTGDIPVQPKENTSNAVSALSGGEMRRKHEMRPSVSINRNVTNVNVNRKEEEEDLFQKKTGPEISRKGNEDLGRGPPRSDFSSKLNQSRGGGQPMDNGTQTFMNSRFGTDFSNVRIHNNSSAASMSDSINAKAFTHQNNIYFNKGQYQPGTYDGKKLLAHELTHTIQQGAVSGNDSGESTVQTKLKVGSPNDQYEREADDMADRVMRSAMDPQMTLHSAQDIQRKCATCEEESLQRKELSLSSTAALSTFGSEGSKAITANLSNKSISRSSEATASFSSKGVNRSSKTSTSFSSKDVSRSSEATASFSSKGVSRSSEAEIQRKTWEKEEEYNPYSSGPSIQRKTQNTVQREPVRGPPGSISADTSGKIRRGFWDDPLGSIGGAISSAAEWAGDSLSAGIDWLKGELSDMARNMPGYSLFSVVIGQDPITHNSVERNGRNFIEAGLDVIPNGADYKRKLEEDGGLAEAAEWLDQEINQLDFSVSDVSSDFSRFISSLSLSDITSPSAALTRGINVFRPYVERVIRFASNVAIKLLEIVKEFAINALLEFVRDQTPWYPLITVVLGEDPITGDEVERNGMNILRGFILLHPEGDAQLAQMQESGSLQRAADWVDESIIRVTSIISGLRNGFTTMWETFSITNLLHPIDTFNQIYGLFNQPVSELISFALEVAIMILQFIKDALIARLIEYARTIPGYHLVTVIMGKDIFSEEPVERSPINIIRGFMSLVPGGEEKFQELQQTGAIEEALAWIEGAVTELDLTWPMVRGLFTTAWNTFTLADLATPIQTFQRVMDLFGAPLFRLIRFVGRVVIKLVEIALRIMGFPFELIGSIISRAQQAYELIKNDPIGFLKNILRAVKQAFVQFFGNILTHLMTGVGEWLFGQLGDAGITIPSDFSFQSILGLVFQILGITRESIFEKLREKVGPERWAQIEGTLNTLTGIWSFVSDVVTRGPIAIWEKVQEQLSNLWETVLSAARNWIMTRIITQITVRLLSMLDPTGIMAVVNSFMVFFNAVQSAIEYMIPMLEMLNSFLGGVVQIAQGNIQPAADFLERTMARGMPILIGFLANQVGLGGIGRRIREVIESIQERVDQGIQWAIDRAWELGAQLLQMGRNAVGAARDAVSNLFNFFTRRTQLSLQEGHHSIYFSNGQLMMASEERPIIRQMEIELGEAQNIDEIAAIFGRLKVKITEANRNYNAERIRAGDNGEISAADSAKNEQLRIKYNEIKSDCETLLNDARVRAETMVPTTVIRPGSLVNGFSNGATADPLSIARPVANGLRVRGSSPSTILNTHPYNIIGNRKTRPTGGVSYWKAGHLVAEELYGSGNDPGNITPMDNSANLSFSAGIEQTVKNQIWVHRGSDEAVFGGADARVLALSVRISGRAQRDGRSTASLVAEHRRLNSLDANETDDVIQILETEDNIPSTINATIELLRRPETPGAQWERTGVTHSAPQITQTLPGTIPGAPKTAAEILIILKRKLSTKYGQGENKQLSFGRIYPLITAHRTAHWDVNNALLREYWQNTLGGKQTPGTSGSVSPKLKVGSPNDPMELEADQMADKVMRMPDMSLKVQRKCTACEEEDKQMIQRSAEGWGGTKAVSSGFQSRLNTSSGQGRPMDNSTKSFMESGFGADFSNVNIHTGAEANALSSEINARAFTTGNDIYFNQGEYNPNTTSGKHLLAHELTHTIQQGASKTDNIQRKTPWDLVAEDRELKPNRVPTTFNYEIIRHRLIAHNTTATDINQIVDVIDVLNLYFKVAISRVETKKKLTDELGTSKSGKMDLDITPYLPEPVRKYLANLEEWYNKWRKYIAENGTFGQHYDKVQKIPNLTERERRAKIMEYHDNSPGSSDEVTSVCHNFVMLLTGGDKEGAIPGFSGPNYSHQITRDGQEITQFYNNSLRGLGAYKPVRRSEVQIGDIVVFKASRTAMRTKPGLPETGIVHSAMVIRVSGNTIEVFEKENPREPVSTRTVTQILREYREYGVRALYLTPGLQGMPEKDEAKTGATKPTEPFNIASGKAQEDTHILFKVGMDFSKAHQDRKLMRFIAENQTSAIKFKVHGYASVDGDEMQNLNLSGHRAIAVKNALLQHLPKGSSAEVFAHGETEAFGDLKQNRRAGIKLESSSSSGTNGSSTQTDRVDMLDLNLRLMTLEELSNLTFFPSQERFNYLDFSPLPAYGDLTEPFSSRGLLVTDREFDEILQNWESAYNFYHRKLSISSDIAKDLADLSTSFAYDTQLSIEFPTQEEELINQGMLPEPPPMLKIDLFKVIDFFGDMEGDDLDGNINRKESGGSTGFTPRKSFETGLAKTKGAGKNMGASTQRFMESRFGADFSNVKIHTGTEAAELNNEIQAKAFTNGNDIYFNSGEYNPETPQGKHLLAHELTHTIQQGGAHSNNVQRKTPTGIRVKHQQAGDFSNLSDSNKRKYSSYIAGVTQMEVTPEGDYKGNCVKEYMTVIVNDCPKKMMEKRKNTPFCTGNKCLEIGRYGKAGDSKTGIMVPDDKSSFIDNHKSSAPFSYLEETGVDKCQVICHQKYAYNRKDYLGSFYVIRTFKAGKWTDPTTKEEKHITGGSIVKYPAAEKEPPSKDDFEKKIRPGLGKKTKEKEKETTPKKEDAVPQKIQPKRKANPGIQRKCAECEKEEKVQRKTNANLVQRVNAGPDFEVSGILDDKDQEDNVVYFDRKSSALIKKQEDKIVDFMVKNMGSSDIYLYGYTPDEGFEKKKKALLSDRLKVVESKVNSLKKKSVKVHAIERPKRGKKSYNYRKFRAVEMSAAPIKPGAHKKNTKTRNCNPTEVRQIDKIRGQAITEIGNTISKVEAYQADPKKHAGVEAIIDRNFKSHSDKTLKQILKVYKMIKGDLGKINSDKKRQCSSLDHTFCSKATAAASAQDDVTFCPKFFKESEPHQQRVFIHEMGHYIKLGLDDRGYAHNRVFKFLSTREALLNTDTFAIMSIELNGAQYKGLENTKVDPSIDSVKGCGKNKEMVEEALARAQRWNGYANAGLRQTYPEWSFFKEMSKYLVRHFGPVNVYSVAGLVDRTAKLKRKYKNKFTFNCAKNTDAICTVKGNDNVNLGPKNIFHVCPDFFKLDGYKRAVAVGEEVAKLVSSIPAKHRTGYAKIGHNYKVHFWKDP